MSKEYSKFIKRADFAINSGISFEQQGEYVHKLFNLERQFQDEILKIDKDDQIYSNFMVHITENLKNILRAKTYFRVKEKDFNKNLSPIFKNKDVKSLKLYQISYPLMSFIIKDLPKKHRKAHNLYNKYSEVRNVIIRSMMGLAISKANSFYESNKNKSVDKLDFINVAMVGLCAGIDKYTPENNQFTNVFRSVCLAYITRFLIESNGQSLTKLPSGDKKMLYKINILRFRQGVTDPSKIAEQLTAFYQDLKDKGKSAPKLPITVDKVKTLMEASSTDKDEQESFVPVRSDSCYYNMEEDFQKAEVYSEVGKAIKTLSIKEIKVIKLKGVDL